MPTHIGLPAAAALALAAMVARCGADPGECQDAHSGGRCVAAGQSCFDEINNHPYGYEYECSCIAPETGRTRFAGLANCILPDTDECTVQGRGMDCIDFGQTCVDPDRNVGYDYVCTCAAGVEGPPMTGHYAHCWVDECRDGSPLRQQCDSLGMHCVDPVMSTDTGRVTEDGNGYCQCELPADRMPVGGTVTGNMYSDCGWIPASGVPSRGVWHPAGYWIFYSLFTGTIGNAGDLQEVRFVREDTGEPRYGHFIVPDSPSQAAIDEKALGAWLGAKPTPSCSYKLGDVVRTDPVPVASDTTCMIDECVEHEPTCLQHSQTCEDPNHSSLSKNDWECSCAGNMISVPPNTPGVAEPATCVDPPGDCTKHGHVCEDEGQLCDAGADEWDDAYECVCTPPSTGSKNANAPANCVLNECTTECASCNKNANHLGGRCEEAGQVCVDADTSPHSEQDWRCRCPSPYRGEALLAPAPRCGINECTKACDHCAGQTCADATNQECIEPDVTVRGDWYCECVAPWKGVSGAAATPQDSTPAAVCTVNECEAPVAGAMPPRLNEDTCIAAGQECRDPTDGTDAASLGDWLCLCLAWPQEGAAEAAAATCTVDECKSATEDGVYHTLCGATQRCVDPDHSAMGGFECHCEAPAVSQSPGAGGPAACTLDECATVCAHCADMGAGDVCAAAGQTCVERGTAEASQGDWSCVCADVPVSALAGPVAACGVRNECEDAGSSAVLSGKHYHRYDRDGCLCWTGWHVDAATVCTGGVTCEGPGSAADEPCDAGCCNPDQDANGEWCFKAPGAFNDAKQECAGRASEWQYCVAPGVLPLAGGKVEALPFGREHADGIPDSQANVCTDVGQLCVDGAEANDWRCQCVAPLSGEDGAGAPAACILDECDEQAATCLSATPPQRCEDADKGVDARGGWVCVCAVGPATTQLAAVVPSCELNECDGNEACPAMAQACEDPAPRTDSMDDWHCVCNAPAVTVGGQRQAAVCTLDECATVCPTCADTGDGGGSACRTSEDDQTCVDADQDAASTGDWTCVCTAPAQGRMVAATATCALDECVHGQDVECEANGQTCTDPMKTTVATGDWYCECQTPYHGKGAAGAGIATCEYDECAEHAGVCSGQRCVDTDKEADHTWVCQCIGPDEKGADVPMAKATCEATAECVDNTACSDAGQLCHDDAAAPDALNNWVCRCIAPYHGEEALMGPATCAINECDEVCATCLRIDADEADKCAAHGQVCEDADETAASSWVCKCPAHAGGAAAAAGVAACTIDECAVTDAACTSCARGACGAGQACEDADTDAQSLHDWVCTCTNGAPNVGQQGPAATCEFNECATDAAAQETCADAATAQHCVDTDPATAGTWECRCDPPGSGAAQMAAAAGCDEFDECSTACAHCADTGAGDVCAAAGQTCADPSTSVQGDWTCVCAAPSAGSKAGAPVPLGECALNECEAQCPTCADKGAGTPLCATAGQMCVEGATTADATGDWQCQCAAPLEFRATTAALATCSLDECTEAAAAGGGDAAGKVCADAGQVCHDPAPGTLGDYECSCAAPRVGSAVAAAAECTLNECSVPSNRKTCTDATFLAYGAQECRDPSEATDGDWVCVCPAPAAGNATAGAASCEVDECLMHGEVCERAATPQRCADPDRAALGDWVCGCVAPAEAEVGSGAQRAAACMLDECTAECATCANGACGGQTCADVDRAPTSRNDWTCTCLPPSTDSAPGRAVEVCTVDECIAHAATCEAATPPQTCEDNDPAASGTWECVCAKPAAGRGQRGAAACVRNECAETEACARAGQRCKDRNEAATSLNDWECRCVAPAIGAPALLAPAACSMDGECADAANSAVCTAAGQRCEDPDIESDGDWLCRCIAPARGTSAQGAPAACTLDECSTACPSCAGTTCTRQGQQCVDEDQGYRGAALGDWECRCAAPKTGSKVGMAVPACGLNECSVHGAVCAGNGQDCIDADTFADGTWQCECRAPAMGAPGNQRPAACVFDFGDECATHSATCAAAGQRCVDPSTSVNGDWACHCSAPAVGAPRTGGVAACVLDECDEKCDTCAGEMCTAAGQECVDAATDAAVRGDWACRCVAPATGEPSTGAPAACAVVSEELDECAGMCGTCAGDACSAAGQECVDVRPSTQSTGDWECRCRLPLAGPPRRGGATKCEVPEVDECQLAAVRDVCDTRTSSCYDTDLAVDDTWECRCNEPGIGYEELGPVSCAVLNECDDAANVAVCATGHPPQQCVDNDPEPDTWECHCYLESGEGGAWHVMGRYPHCPLFGDCNDDTVSSVCEGAGQRCHDPDVSTDGDWQCVCAGQEAGPAGEQGPAVCSFDECAAAQCVGGARSSCPHMVCHDENQACEDVDGQKRNTWQCRCKAPHDTTRTAQRAPVVQCIDRPHPVSPAPTWAPKTRSPAAPATPVPTLPVPVQGAGGADEEECSTWLACYWWVLLVLLLLLCCSCALAAALLLVRRRAAGKTANDSEDWQNTFAAGKENETSNEDTMREASKSLLAEEMSPAEKGSEEAAAPAAPKKSKKSKREEV